MAVESCSSSTSYRWRHCRPVKPGQRRWVRTRFLGHTCQKERMLSARKKGTVSPILSFSLTINRALCLFVSCSLPLALSLSLLSKSKRVERLNVLLLGRQAGRQVQVSSTCILAYIHGRYTPDPPILNPALPLLVKSGWTLSIF